MWPEAVTGAGYRTAGIGKMHFPPWDARLGFVERITAEDKRQYFWPDDYEKFLRANGIAKHHPTGLPGYFETLQASVFPHPRRFHVDAYVGDQAAEWIARYGGRGAALRRWVSFPGPHDPYDPPQEMAAMYDGAPIPEPIPAPAGRAPCRRGPGRGAPRVPSTSSTSPRPQGSTTGAGGPTTTPTSPSSTRGSGRSWAPWRRAGPWSAR